MHNLIIRSKLSQCKKCAVVLEKWVYPILTKKTGVYTPYTHVYPVHTTDSFYLLNYHPTVILVHFGLFEVFFLNCDVVGLIPFGHTKKTVNGSLLVTPHQELNWIANVNVASQRYRGQVGVSSQAGN